MLKELDSINKVLQEKKKKRRSDRQNVHKQQRSTPATENPVTSPEAKQMIGKGLL